MAAATDYIRVRGVTPSLDAPLMGSTKIHGPKAKLRCRSTKTDSVRQLASMILNDLDGILRWDQCHWKLYEILVPPI